MTVLPRSSSGFENSGWSKENPGWGPAARWRSSARLEVQPLGNWRWRGSRTAPPSVTLL